nr:hypothetical protein [Abalone asfa-like virus]
MFTRFRTLAIGIYWIVLSFENGPPTNIEEQFVVTNYKYTPHPNYFVVNDQFLYILFETPKLEDGVLKIFVNLTNSEFAKIHNSTFMDKTHPSISIFEDYTALAGDIPAPKANITSVLANIPKEYIFPDHINSLFMSKYENLTGPVTWRPVTVTKYTFIGKIHWLFIKFRENITPKIDEDFIVLLDGNTRPPLFYVSEGANLYILLEVLKVSGPPIYIYVNNQTTEFVVPHAYRTIEPYNKTYHKMASLNIYAKQLKVPIRDPVRSINYVLTSNIPSNYRHIPARIIDKFREKYVIILPTTLPPLTNG